MERRKPTKEQFSTFDVVKITGINRETLQDWIERRLIIPSIKRANGVGTKSLFSREDLYRIKLFYELINTYGMKRQYAAKKTYIGLSCSGMLHPIIVDLDNIKKEVDFKIKVNT